MRRGVRALEDARLSARFGGPRTSATIEGRDEEKPHPHASASARSSSAPATPSPSRACAPRAPRTSTPPSSRPRRSARPGGDLVRVAVDSPKDVEALAEVRRQTTANLVVDLQENYRLAASVAPHVDKIRYNPGHLYHHEKEKPVAREGRASSSDVAREHDLRDPHRASTAAASTPR